MTPNTKLIEALDKLGVQAELSKIPGKKRYNSHISTTLGGISRLVKEAGNLPYSSQYSRNQILTNYSGHLNPNNYKLAKLLKEMEGEIDMTHFIAAKKRINETGLANRLRTATGLSKPKRKRTLSEYEGEYDFDRKWDIKPFHAMHKPPRIGRVVTVNVNFDFSVSCDEDSIQEYGATCWAIADLIESSGVSVRLLMSIDGFNVANGVDHSTRIELKKAGQYTAPSLLAACFQESFFRRIGFALFVLSGDISSQAGSCGGPSFWPNRIEFKEGELRISPACMNGKVVADMDGLVRALEQALGTQGAA